MTQEFISIEGITGFGINHTCRCLCQQAWAQCYGNKTSK